ncbi:hypothetical protein EW145_g7706 [Phellinidium pouzarii]|uniref:Uncharacterized protein n=1 Tax=Phellinidium pouzarii TaxID=167371 RepID=A0A4S4KH37_9AGAM|nr:hypothetical protein EW145_g7706 [Phellinidium pouzarii]
MSTTSVLAKLVSTILSNTPAPSARVSHHLIMSAPILDEASHYRPSPRPAPHPQGARAADTHRSQLVANCEIRIPRRCAEDGRRSKAHRRPAVEDAGGTDLQSLDAMRVRRTPGRMGVFREGASSRDGSICN